MSDLGPLHIFFYTVALLFPVANPIGLAGQFYSITSHMEKRERKIVAWRVALYFFILVSCTLVFGILVLRVFDISVGIVDIAGGLVLFHTAWVMLHQTDNDDANAERSRDTDLAFFPLTMPLTADAAVLAIALSVSNSLQHHWGLAPLLEYLFATAGIGAVALAVGLFYGSSHATIGRLEKTGIRMINSITAFLMLAVAVEIATTGIEDVIRAFQSG